MNNTSACDGISAKVFKILKDDAVKSNIAQEPGMSGP